MSKQQTKHGSKRHIQVLVNDLPDLLNDAITSKFPQLSEDQIEWIAPLKENDYYEPCDSRFWEIVNQVSKVNKEDINSFWPSGGPRWDAVAVTNNNRIILIEAKAHISEMSSDSEAIDERSIALIKKSIKDTKAWLNVDSDNDWQKDYYQKSNRLAHLYFLKKVCDIEVYLVYVYILGDNFFTDKVDTADKWQVEINREKEYLGILNNDVLTDCFADIFLPIPDKENYKK